MEGKLFRDDSREEIERSRLTLLALAQASSKVQELHLLYDHSIPFLYNSEVYYHVEPDDSPEHWSDIPTVLERRWGDCDDLAPWKVAELRVRHGIEADPLIRWSKFEKKIMYHMLVVYPKGAKIPRSYSDLPPSLLQKALKRDEETGRIIEDPSKALGLGTAIGTMPFNEFYRLTREKNLYRKGIGK